MRLDDLLLDAAILDWFLLPMFVFWLWKRKKPTNRGVDHAKEKE